MDKRFGGSPSHWVLLMLAGWMNREQQRAMDYVLEENRVLRARQKGPLRFTDSERARLGVKVYFP